MKWTSYLFLGILTLFLIALAISFYRKHQFEKSQKRHQEPTLNQGDDHHKISQTISSDGNDDIYDTDLGLLENNRDAEKHHQDSASLIPNIETQTKTYIPDLIILNVMAAPEQEYTGYELLQALLSAGLRHGSMNIFHRHEQINGKGELLFSVASATEPGIFELNKMGGFSCKGLTFFMQLSNLKDPMQGFEIMLDSAKQLLEDLGGILRDEKHELLSEAKIKEWRTNIQNFEQTKHIADLFA
jgi:cell division protein ZipA